MLDQLGKDGKGFEAFGEELRVDLLEMRERGWGLELEVREALQSWEIVHVDGGCDF